MVPPANNEFPGRAWERWIMARARAGPSAKAKLVREPMALPSSELQEAGVEIVGQVEGDRREVRMQR